MTDLIRAGDPVLFMKVGMHAQESLDDIIARKQAEIDRMGFAMWGYGGPTCPPGRVRPYAVEQRDAGQVIRLVMEPVNSKHARTPNRASHFSVDNKTWEAIPQGIDVLGSKYALCITNLRETDQELPLGATKVAIGPSRGKVGAAYVQGQIDKACLEVVSEVTEGKVASIRLEADIVDPWAVFLRTPEA